MRFELVTPELLSVRESQGLVKDIYDPLAMIRQPLSQYQTMLDLIMRDPTLSTAYDIIVDTATHRGYDFTGGTKQKRDELRTLFYDMNFTPVLSNVLYQLCYYGDAFLELRKNNSSKPNELWPLETTEMRIVYDKHGKVEGYIQRPFSLATLDEAQIIEKEKSMGVFFNPEEVIHFRMKWIGSQVYSYNPNDPLTTAAATNLYAGNYLMQIFMNMPPRYVAHLAGINKSEYESAKKEFQSSKTNYKKTIAFSRGNDPNSQLQLQKVDPPYDKELLDVMKYLRNEVLKVTRVPRSWIEESGVENRGVTEAEQRPFDIRIQAIHRNILEPQINLVLLKALGYYKKAVGAEDYVMFRFNEISRQGEKEILANLAVLQSVGLKPVAMKRYIDERGILGFDEDDFQDMSMQQGSFGEKPKDLFPSRQREDKAVDKMKSNLNERGVSSVSGKKMGVE